MPFITPSGFRGYVTHREFGGYMIPVPTQNLVLRDYCARNNLLFKLSVNEFFFPGSYVQLENILVSLPTLEGIVMCSMFMLPKTAKEREKIYNRVIETNTQLHLVLENRVIKSSDDVQALEEVFDVTQALTLAPKTIPTDLLPDLHGQDKFNQI